MHNTAENQFLA